jgi:3-mercaptopyruvate sulfurtransferase SseA
MGEVVEMKREKLRLFFSSVLLLFLMLPVSVYADDVPRISKEQLRELIGNANNVLLDARLVKEWRKSDGKIPGAVRVDPHDVSSWAGKYAKDQRIVVYCA